MDKILELQDVRKSYGGQRAVNDVSFSVKQGAIFGLLGPNGAGKTSTIRMITGITYPDRGTVTLFGEPQQALHQNRIGYMPEERGLYKKLAVREQLEYLGALKGLNAHDLAKRIDHWLDLFEIRSWEKKKTSDLSKGMQQKLQFIVTVLHDPELLVLDEPLSGLDPINAEIINDIVIDLRKHGKTIILSTHRMEQVEQLCDEIVLMNYGSVVLAGSVRELKRGAGRTMISLRYDSDTDLAATIPPTLCAVREHTPNELLLELAHGTSANALLTWASERAQILKWEVVEPPIKELFLEAVRERSATEERVLN